MWYRLYLASMDKKEYNKMLKLTESDFIKKYSQNGDDHIWLYEITNGLYELWKYVDYSE